MPDPPSRAACLASWTLDVPLLASKDPVPTRLLRVDRKHVRVVDQSSAWPHRTEQWCWYCCHPFDTPPLPMPIGYDDKRDLFHVQGVFCGWACMKAHNLESASYLKSANANNITLFRKRCTGALRGIKPAPPRQALRVFGGSMSIDEFREASGKQLEYAVLPPRMIVHHHAIQETDTSQRLKRAVKPDLAAVVNFKDVHTKNETLRLKRPKPLQNNKNLLERTMGINAVVK